MKSFTLCTVPVTLNENIILRCHLSGTDFKADTYFNTHFCRWFLATVECYKRCLLIKATLR